MKLEFAKNKIVDLLEDGDFVPYNEIEWEHENQFFKMKGDYIFKGWVFSNCELTGTLENEPEFEVEAEDVINQAWDTWEVSPTPETKVIEQGESGALEYTVFSSYEF